MSDLNPIEVILIFDIGKTNKKVLLFNENLDVISTKSVELPETIDEALAFAEAKSVLNPDFDREGVVFRTMDRKISFKAISNKFLLNEK